MTPHPLPPVYSGGCGMENKNFSNFWSILASFVKLDILGTPCILSDTPCDSWMFCRRAMFSLLGDVKGLIKLDKLCIDNNVFRLHYKVRLPKKKMWNYLTQATFIILLTASILVTAKQYMGLYWISIAFNILCWCVDVPKRKGKFVKKQIYPGDPIDCIVGDGVPSDVMDTYCWIHSTFT